MTTKENKLSLYEPDYKPPFVIMPDMLLEKGFSDKWQAALVSGKYKQGEGALLRYGKYCCLGVAGIVCALSVADLEWGLVFYNTDQQFLLKIPRQLLTQRQNGSELIDFLTFKNDNRYHVMLNKEQEHWSFHDTAYFIKKYLTKSE